MDEADHCVCGARYLKAEDFTSLGGRFDTMGGQCMDVASGARQLHVVYEQSQSQMFVYTLELQ